MSFVGGSFSESCHTYVSRACLVRCHVIKELFCLLQCIFGRCCLCTGYFAERHEDGGVKSLCIILEAPHDLIVEVLCRIVWNTDKLTFQFFLIEYYFRFRTMEES